MMSLQVAFSSLVEKLRDVRTVKGMKVLDEGEVVVSLEQPGFVESVVIYLLAGELSLGFIKKAVNANTRADVHTLFIVSQDLIPENGSITPPDDALRLLLDLYAGKFYAYVVRGRSVSIFPVTIDTHGRVSYGNAVDIARLSIDYVAIYSNHIWGVRKVADFAGQRTQRPVSYPKHDPLQPFYDLLGIANSASEDEIKKAYRRKARLYHPDRDSSPEATRRMQRINEAYEQIMKRFE